MILYDTLNMQQIQQLKLKEFTSPDQLMFNALEDKLSFYFITLKRKLEKIFN